MVGSESCISGAAGTERGVWTYGTDGSFHHIPVLLFLAMLALASRAEQLGLHDPPPPSLPRMDQVGSWAQKNPRNQTQSKRCLLCMWSLIKSLSDSARKSWHMHRKKEWYRYEEHTVRWVTPANISQIFLQDLWQKGCWLAGASTGLVQLCMTRSKLETGMH